MLESRFTIHWLSAKAHEKWVWPLRAGPAHIASRTRARRYAAGVTVVTPSAFPSLSSVTPSSLSACLSSTRTGLSHALSGSHPPSRDITSHGSAVSGHVPLLTPGGHVPTLPHVPWVTSPFPPHAPPGYVPSLPIANPNLCTRCTVLTGSAAHGSRAQHPTLQSRHEE